MPQPWSQENTSIQLNISLWSSLNGFPKLPFNFAIALCKFYSSPQSFHNLFFFALKEEHKFHFLWSSVSSVTRTSQFLSFLVHFSVKKKICDEIKSKLRWQNTRTTNNTQNILISFKNTFITDSDETISQLNFCTVQR